MATPSRGPGLIRKWERRFALSSEYVIKAVYATVIGTGASAGYTPDVLTRYAVVAGWSDSLNAGGTAGDSLSSRFRTVLPLDRGYSLVSVNRYDLYRHALLALSDHADRVRLAEISGSELVTVSGTAPTVWGLPARTSAIVAYAMPDDSTRTRMLLKVRVRDVLEVLRRFRAEGVFRVEHIYDY